MRITKLSFPDIGQTRQTGDRAFDLIRFDFQVGMELGKVVVAANFGDHSEGYVSVAHLSQGGASEAVGADSF